MDGDEPGARGRSGCAARDFRQLGPATTAPVIGPDGGTDGGPSHSVRVPALSLRRRRHVRECRLPRRHPAAQRQQCPAGRVLHLAQPRPPRRRLQRPLQQTLRADPPQPASQGKGQRGIALPGQKPTSVIYASTLCLPRSL